MLNTLFLAIFPEITEDNGMDQDIFDINEGF